MEKEKRLPVYEARLDEESGILAISFVKSPAIEHAFVALEKEPQVVHLSVDSQKQILTGPVLIPDKLIYRNDSRLGEYYLKFSASEIEAIAHKMMRAGIALSSTTHQHLKTLDGNFLTELWIIADPEKDKSVALGMSGLPAGTLMESYKITDREYWENEVLTGNVKGFSLEGLFNINSINMEKNKKETDATLEKILSDARERGKTYLSAQDPKKEKKTVKERIKALFEDTVTEAEDLVDQAAKDETNSGEPYLILPLAAGGEAFVAADGFCTLDGEQMSTGSHELANGNFLVVDEGGMMVITQTESETESPAEPPVNLSEARKRGNQFMSLQATIRGLEKKVEKLEKTPSSEPARPVVESPTGTDGPVPVYKRIAAELALSQTRKK